MATKKQNRRGKVRRLRRLLNRTKEPIKGANAKRLYNWRQGDGFAGRERTKGED